MTTRAHFLHSLATVRAGHPFRGRISEDIASPTLAVQLRDTSPDTGIAWQSCIHTRLPGTRAPAWLKEDQILFAGRGTRYYAVVVRNIPPGLYAVAAPQFFILEAKTEGLLPAFLAWQLNEAPCQRYFDQQAEGTLTKSIRRSVLEQTPIAMPPLDQQKAIVALADTFQKEQNTLEQLIQNNKRLLGGIAGDLARAARLPQRRRLAHSRQPLSGDKQ